jgi:hypothetical protein
MKDILICFCLLLVGAVIGIAIEQRYPEYTSKYLPELGRSLTRVHYLNEITPNGVEENGAVLLLHKGGHVTWKDWKPLFLPAPVAVDE